MGRNIASALAFQQYRNVSGALHPVPLLLFVAALSGCGSAQRYADTCSTPLAGWLAPPDGWHNLLEIRVAVGEDGSLTWNGAPVTRERLRHDLRIIRTLRPMPATILTVHPRADCAAVTLVRQDIDEALDCQQTGACGEGEGERNVLPVVDENSAAYQEAVNAAERALDEAENRSRE